MDRRKINEVIKGEIVNYAFSAFLVLFCNLPLFFMILFSKENWLWYIGIVLFIIVVCFDVANSGISKYVPIKYKKDDRIFYTPDDYSVDYAKHYAWISLPSILLNLWFNVDLDMINISNITLWTIIIVYSGIFIVLINVIYRKTLPINSLAFKRDYHAKEIINSILEERKRRDIPWQLTWNRISQNNSKDNLKILGYYYHKEFDKLNAKEIRHEAIIMEVYFSDIMPIQWENKLWNLDEYEYYKIYEYL